MTPMGELPTHHTCIFTQKMCYINVLSQYQVKIYKSVEKFIGRFQIINHIACVIIPN